MRCAYTSYLRNMRRMLCARHVLVSIAFWFIPVLMASYSRRRGAYDLCVTDACDTCHMRWHMRRICGVCHLPRLLLNPIDAEPSCWRLLGTYCIQFLFTHTILEVWGVSPFRTSPTKSTVNRAVRDVHAERDLSCVHGFATSNLIRSLPRIGAARFHSIKRVGLIRFCPTRAKMLIDSIGFDYLDPRPIQFDSFILIIPVVL